MAGKMRIWGDYFLCWRTLFLISSNNATYFINVYNLELSKWSIFLMETCIRLCLLVIFFLSIYHLKKVLSKLVSQGFLWQKTGSLCLGRLCLFKCLSSSFIRDPVSFSHMETSQLFGPWVGNLLQGELWIRRRGHGRRSQWCPGCLQIPGRFSSTLSDLFTCRLTV